MTPIAIRPIANDDEAAACAHIMATSEPWLTLQRDYAACLAVMRLPDREVYVATHAERVVGFVTINMRGAFVGYIQTIAVDASARGQGVGSQLLAFAEQRIFSESPNVFLCVSSFNTDAQRLYTRRGFVVVGTLTDYIVAGYDEILMRKTRGPLIAT